MDTNPSNAVALTESEFASARGNRDALNVLIEQKIGLKGVLPANASAELLGNAAKINLLIASAARLAGRKPAAPAPPPAPVAAAPIPPPPPAAVPPTPPPAPAKPADQLAKLRKAVANVDANGVRSALAALPVDPKTATGIMEAWTFIENVVNRHLDRVARMSKLVEMVKKVPDPDVQAALWDLQKNLVEKHL